MTTLLLAWLFCMLYFRSSLLYIDPSAASSEDPSVDNVDEDVTCGKPQKKPHIVIILADDLGWNDVSFHGSDEIPTPNIDALAYNGIILNNHYVPAMCTPSRTSLMTGKYPIRVGMQHYVIFPSEPRGLPLNEKLLPQYLKEAGYKTHMIGKWHLGFHKRAYTPMYRGFYSHFGYYNGFQDYYSHHVIDSIPSVGDDHPPFEGIDMRRNMSVAWDTVGKYTTDLFTEEAVRLINSHDKDDPMFLYLAHLAPHSGNTNDLLQAPAEEIAKFSYIADPNRRIYAAMVSKLDQSVGEVVEALRHRRMLENTIILFMSDNGAPTVGSLRNDGSNYPLRGMKNSPWEGGVRGVAAMWSPLIKKRERVSNQLMYMTDWLPTLLSAAGVSNTKIPKTDGQDLWTALILDRPSSRYEILLNIDSIYPYAAIRRDKFKYIDGQSNTPSTWIGDSGRSKTKEQPPYDPDQVLRSKAAIAIASVQKIRRRLSERKTEKTAYFSEMINLEKSKLTPRKILQLRREAEVHCNVMEEEKIPCDPVKSPCLFNIEEDPCELINIIDQYPLVAARLKWALVQYRLNTMPPTNKHHDSRADPKFWNNTWTYWQDSDS